MTSDNAPDIRALLEAEAAHAPAPSGMTSKNILRARARRTMLLSASALGIMLAVTSVSFAALSIGGDNARLDPAADGWIAITDIAQLQKDGVVYNASYGAFAVWNEGEPLVVSEVVPHIEEQRERALFCTTSETFDGPHGEKFDRRGYYYGGPARHGLDRYESRVDEEVLYFDPDHLSKGPARGQGPALEPVGRFCSEEHIEAEPGFAAPARSTGISRFGVTVLAPSSAIATKGGNPVAPARSGGS